MEHFFIELAQTHLQVFKQFGYFIMFLVTFIESIPLVGMLIPGQTIIILVGFLVKLHFFGFWIAITVTAIAATLGDLLGFALGRKYGHHLSLLENKFYIKPEQLANAKRLIVENPFKSIFFGRLHSLTRTLTPFAGGASGVSLKKFIAIDILSSFTWAFLSILVGYIFGKSFEKASAFIGSFLLVATFITVCIIITVYYAKKKQVRIAKTDVSVFIASTISVYLFALIAQDLKTGKLFSILDHRIYLLRNMITSDSMTAVMNFFTVLGNPIYMVSLASLFLLYLVGIKQYRRALLAGSVLATGLVAVNILKAYFERIRPIGIIPESGSSFPSGHMAMSMMLAILLTYTVLRYIQSPHKKNILIGLVYVVSLLIGFSRIYLGVHWATDVLAGLLFGIFWATFGIVLWKIGKFVLKITKQKHALPLP